MTFEYLYETVTMVTGIISGCHAKGTDSFPVPNEP